MSEFDTGIPSIRQIQGYIKNQLEVELKVTTGDSLKGKVIWQDPECICLIDSQQQKTMVWRQGLVYIKPAS